MMIQNTTHFPSGNQNDKCCAKSLEQSELLTVWIFHGAMKVWPCFFEFNVWANNWYFEIENE